MAPDSTAQDRFEVAQRIVQLFRWERFSYLGLTFITACVVIIVGFQDITKKDASVGSAGLLFGSAGVVTFNISRLLNMFNVIILQVFGPDTDTTRRANGGD
jgi:hypothetical protein